MEPVAILAHRVVLVSKVVRVLMDSKALQETKGHLEPQDHKGFLVNLVIEGHRALQVVKDLLGLLDHKEQLEAQG